MADCTVRCTSWQVSVFSDAAIIMCDFIKKINSEGFKLQYLNIGGGLGEGGSVQGLGFEGLGRSSLEGLSRGAL
jgi:hypothetical protein